MTRIMSVAQTPPTSVSPEASVLEAVEAMARDRVGAVLALAGEKLEGIFTERDVMMKVVLQKLDPAKTPISTVMTRNVLTIAPDLSEEEALALMLEHHIRHLPVQGDRGAIVGIVSIRNVLQDRCEHLEQEVDSLVAYMGADGPGG
ncbi:MAG: CBS domain-containing protein [Candidatus Wallbacteria bacterium]|nr:CBS domain-containing protein [Candidatus Wallbacteria bacterium]